MNTHQAKFYFSPLLPIFIVLVIFFSAHGSISKHAFTILVFAFLSSIFTFCQAATAIVARVSIKQVKLFFGPKLFDFHLFSIRFTICIIPTGGYVQFYTHDDQIHSTHDKYYDDATLAWRLSIITSGPLALFAISCICMGSEMTMHKLPITIYHILAGAICPLSYGHLCMSRLYAAYTFEGIRAFIGYSTMALFAFNLLPFTPNWTERIARELLHKIIPSPAPMVYTVFSMLLLSTIYFVWIFVFTNYVILDIFK